jgi:hypothetical protein
MSEVEKVRSAEKEANLDQKIAEIRRKNEEIEERHKLVTEEAKQNGVPKSFQKATVSSGGQKSGSNNNSNLKTSETVPSTPKKGNGTEIKGNQWSREWDRGKTSAEEWKMNVPEFGDHGNSYFKIDSANGPPRGRGGNANNGSGARGGHQFQRGNGARRPVVKQPHKPGFFHDDRCDNKTSKAEENGNNGEGENGTISVNNGKQEIPSKAPQRNNPRKPANMQKLDNDKNQNDSSKPNMNVSNGFGQRQGSRGGGQPQTQRTSNPGRRVGPGGPIGFRQQHQHQNGERIQNGNKEGHVAPANRNEAGRKIGNETSQKKPEAKFERNQQNFRETNATLDRRSGPSVRGRGFKPFSKPSNYSNPRQSKVTSKSASGNNSKPQNPKLDKDGQAVKRLIDNIIDQVVRHERKEQKKTGDFPDDEKNVEILKNEDNEVKEIKAENHGSSNNEEDKKADEDDQEITKSEPKPDETKLDAPKPEETKVEEKHYDEPAKEVESTQINESTNASPNETPKNEAETKKESNDEKSDQVPESNEGKSEGEASIPVGSEPPKENGSEQVETSQATENASENKFESEPQPLA